MKLSKTSRYGFRILLLLAQGEKLSLVKICELQNLPQSYTANIMCKFVSAGLVKSRRGPGGGYMLAKPASEINMLSIVTLLEGRLSLFQRGDCSKDFSTQASSQIRKALEELKLSEA